MASRWGEEKCFPLWASPSVRAVICTKANRSSVRGASALSPESHRLDIPLALACCCCLPSLRAGHPGRHLLWGCVLTAFLSLVPLDLVLCVRMYVNIYVYIWLIELFTNVMISSAKLVLNSYTLSHLFSKTKSLPTFTAVTGFPSMWGSYWLLTIVKPMPLVSDEWTSDLPAPSLNPQLPGHPGDY